MTSYKCTGCDNHCIFSAPIKIRDPWLCPLRGIAVKWEDHIENYARHDVVQTMELITQNNIRQDVEQLIEKYQEQKDDHPAYYGGADNPYEAIKVIEANGWMEGFCLGNVHKYTVRKGEKPNEEALKDLRKARDYLDFYIKHLERSGQE